MALLSKMALTLSLVGLGFTLPAEAQTATPPKMDKETTKGIDKLFEAAGIKPEYLGVEPRKQGGYYELASDDLAHFQQKTPNVDGSTTVSDYYFAFKPNDDDKLEKKEFKGLYVEMTNDKVRGSLKAQTYFPLQDPKELSNHTRWAKMDARGVWEDGPNFPLARDMDGPQYADAIHLMGKTKTIALTFRTEFDKITTAAKMPAVGAPVVKRAP